MNFPRYQFAKENEKELLQFLKSSKDQKLLGRNVDFKSYGVWKSLLPPDPHLLKQLRDYEQRITEIPTIDLISDEEPYVNTPVIVDINKEVDLIQNNDWSTISDIAYAVKENLETRNELSDLAKEHLLELSDSNLNILLNILQETLGTEDIFHMGVALQNSMIFNNNLVTAFCHNLLIPRIKNEYCEKVVDLMNNLCVQHSSILREECLTALLAISEQEVTITLQYIKKMSATFQSILIRDFILAIGRLNDVHLTVIENIMNVQVEYGALTKLVEMLSNVAEEHTKDKNFGKLLMQVIEALGPHLIQLEQPLKHIIAGHKSVWKSKLEKTFIKSCYEDSQLFSQSFQD